MIPTATSSSTLAERLCERITRHGPIAFRDWMEAALYDEQAGYYRRNDLRRWGREGDYRTSPERSVLFAATFARYFAKLYAELGTPVAWTILEAGAGDGRFARGVLETLQTGYPEVFAATQYVIDEPGGDSRLRAQLGSFADRVEFKSLDDCDQIRAGIIFSNELLDAFPVHRVTVRSGQLLELYVDVGAEQNFEWTTGPLSNAAISDYLVSSEIELKEGQVADVNLEIRNWLQRAARRLANGYLLTVDYGAEAGELFDSLQRPEGTLRAFYRHQFLNDALTLPGEQDLTSTVDWTLVKRAGQELGLETVDFERQDRFLLKAGLLAELELQTQRVVGDAERLRLSTVAREIILPNGMAASFQVLVQRKT
jgi:SAM-dependent MidA family methyltransferase